MDCPHCQKPIYDKDALNCLYCGESLERDTGVMSKFRYPSPKVIFVFIVILILLSFIILIIK